MGHRWWFELETFHQANSYYIKFSPMSLFRASFGFCLAHEMHLVIHMGLKHDLNGAVFHACTHRMSILKTVPLTLHYTVYPL